MFKYLKNKIPKIPKDNQKVTKFACKILELSST